MPKIAIILTNGYADWECAYLNGIGRGYYGIETINVAPGGRQITSLGGLQTLPDAPLETILASAFDALVLCGGTIWETSDAPDIKQLALDFLTQEKHVAAICGGTLALARAGILDKKRHTSNALDFLQSKVPPYSGAAHYVNKVTAMSDQKVITAPGNAPAHFSAAVFRAIGIDEKTVSQFLEMTSMEHTS